MSEPARYPAQVFWSEEDCGFVALATDLPGCSAFGTTQQEAISELQDAIRAWQAATAAAGNPVPEPSEPLIESAFSGKVLVRMPRTLHRHLADGAKAQNVSLNHYIVFMLTAAVTSGPFREPVAARTSPGLFSLQTAMLPAGGGSLLSSDAFGPYHDHATWPNHLWVHAWTASESRHQAVTTKAARQQSLPPYSRNVG